MPDMMIIQKYADLYEKYGHAWADAFNKVQGRGWILIPDRPMSMPERNRIFVDFVTRGYAVHTEVKYGIYYIYVMKQHETGGRGIIQEYADMYEKYGPVWADSFNKVRGRGWNLLPVRPRTTDEGFRVFVDFARKGYEVYVEPRNNEYFIYVKKKSIQEGVPEHVYHIAELKEIISGYRLGYTDASIAIDDIAEVVERM